MYPAKFSYVRANSIQEAVALASQHDDAKFIAGGHSLLPLMKLRLATPATLIDIGRLPELRGIRREGNGVTIGALTTHDEVATSAEVQSTVPALAEAAAHIGDQQVRNRGTVGGNIAHGDPASDLPTVFVALDAEIRIQGPNGQRTASAADFFLDILTTDLQPGEIITEIHVPAAPRSAYVKFENPASGYAMIGVCAAVSDGGAKVALGGALAKPARLVDVEKEVAGGKSATDAAQSTANRIGEDDWMGDIHASREYRRAVAPTFVERALSQAMSR